MVVEMAPSPLLLVLVNDHNMRRVTNLGGFGSDQGEGGRHLFLVPGYDGAIPDSYFVSRAWTWKVVVGVRTVPLDGDVSKAIQAIKDGIKVFPLSDPEAASRWRFIDITERRLELPLLAWEGRLDYWRQLHGVIQDNTAQEEDY